MKEFKKLFAGNHPNTLKSRNVLGIILLAEGKFDEAESFFRVLRKETQKIQGDFHPDTMDVIAKYEKSQTAKKNSF